MPSINDNGILFFVVIGLIFLTVIASAQIPDEINTSLKSGNAKTLSDFFNQNVELVVPGSDNVYSKAQAQQIMSDFFSNHQPQGFTIIHQGGKEGAQYVIGNLNTKKGTFRVYFLLKKNDGKNFIHQLRIEKQS